MILFYTYLSFLLGSGFLVVLAASIFKYYKSKISTSLISWLIIRLISDLTSYILKMHFDFNIFPVFHISILIESILLLQYLIELLGTKNKARFLLFLIPVIIFILETCYFSSILTINRISLMSYNSLMTFLTIYLIYNIEQIDEFNRPIIKALFIYHSVGFIQSIFEHIIRVNQETMIYILPLFLSIVVCLNFFITYYLWSMRKK